jgi:hypothetical protein
MLHTGSPGRVGHSFALTNLPLIPRLHEVLDREDTPRPLQGALYRGWIIQVTLEYFGTRLSQSLGGSLSRIACQGPDGKPRLLQNMSRDGAALLARGAGHQYQFTVNRK